MSVPRLLSPSQVCWGLIIPYPLMRFGDSVEQEGAQTGVAVLEVLFHPSPSLSVPDQSFKNGSISLLPDK
jgi:hypothetical protein